MLLGCRTVHGFPLFYELEALNRQRPLTLSIIRLISQTWQVPVTPLIREYDMAS